MSLRSLISVRTPQVQPLLHFLSLVQSPSLPKPPTHCSVFSIPSHCGIDTSPGGAAAFSLIFIHHSIWYTSGKRHHLNCQAALCNATLSSWQVMEVSAVGLWERCVHSDVQVERREWLALDSDIRHLGRRVTLSLAVGSKIWRIPGNWPAGEANRSKSMSNQL